MATKPIREFYACVAFINVVVTLLLIVGLALLLVLPEPGERPRKTLRRSEDTTAEDAEQDENR